MYGTQNTIPHAFASTNEESWWEALAKPAASTSLFATIPTTPTKGGGLFDAIAKVPIAPEPTLSGLSSLWDAPPLTGLVPTPPLMPIIPHSIAQRPPALISPPPVAAAPIVLQWQYVTRRFDQFINTIGVPQPRIDDGIRKQAGIRNCLNRHYWGISSETANSMMIGSWAKSMISGRSSDIDLLFLLPAEVYFNYEGRIGNKQSQLLQEVRGVLSNQGKYQNTEINGDRQVVVVNFDSIPVEILLAFTCRDGSLIICDTKHGGYYKLADPVAELADLEASDTKWNGNTRALAVMGKKWLEVRNVKSLKAFMIERLAVEFLAQWPNSLQDRFWYDWMVRDFFFFVVGRINKSIVMPGTREAVSLGAEWVGEAARAYKHAVTACDHERANREVAAGFSWQEIFGSGMPLRVS
jgi:Second Messenger Oligonucleotide or Dinucleotide Synthetase domain